MATVKTRLDAIEQAVGGVRAIAVMGGEGVEPGMVRTCGVDGEPMTQSDFERRFPDGTLVVIERVKIPVKVDADA